MGLEWIRLRSQNLRLEIVAGGGVEGLVTKVGGSGDRQTTGLTRHGCCGFWGEENVFVQWRIRVEAATVAIPLGVDVIDL